MREKVLIGVGSFVSAAALLLGGAAIGSEFGDTTTVVPSCDWATEIYGGPNQGCVPRADHAAHAEGGHG